MPTININHLTKKRREEVRRKYYKQYRNHPTRRQKHNNTTILKIALYTYVTLSLITAITDFTTAHNNPIKTNTAQALQSITNEIKTSPAPLQPPILEHETQETVKNTTKSPETPQNQSLMEKAQSAIKTACKNKNFGDYCIDDLMGIIYAETRLTCQGVGDNGKAHGCYQIHLGYHPDITIEQANNPEFATNWTLNRLISNGYPLFRSIAIRKHNGSPTNPKTKEYLDTVNYYINNIK